MENEKSPILEIKDLRVTYETDIEVVEAVNGISFQIEREKHSVSSARPALARRQQR